MHIGSWDACILHCQPVPLITVFFSGLQWLAIELYGVPLDISQTKHWVMSWHKPSDHNDLFNLKGRAPEMKTLQIPAHAFHLEYWNSVHYSDVIMGMMASQITGVFSVYSTVCLGTAERKHQSSALLAFVREIHQWPVNSPHEGPVTRKIFHLMSSLWLKFDMCEIQTITPVTGVQLHLLVYHGRNL